MSTAHTPPPSTTGGGIGDIFHHQQQQQHHHNIHHNNNNNLHNQSPPQQPKQKQQRSMSKAQKISRQKHITMDEDRQSQSSLDKIFKFRANRDSPPPPQPQSQQQPTNTFYAKPIISILASKTSAANYTSHTLPKNNTTSLNDSQKKKNKKEKEKAKQQVEVESNLNLNSEMVVTIGATTTMTATSSLLVQSTQGLSRKSSTNSVRFEMMMMNRSQNGDSNEQQQLSSSGQQANSLGIFGSGGGCGGSNSTIMDRSLSSMSCTNSAEIGLTSLNVDIGNLMPNAHNHLNNHHHHVMIMSSPAENNLSSLNSPLSQGLGLTLHIQRW